jgi:type II secretory pathway pseudopilin PulG
MTGRDRMVLMVVVVLAVLGAGWLLVVSPERKKAAEQAAQVTTARTQLEGAQQQAASARTAEDRYQSAYASVVSLGKAVPPLEEVPSLVYELDQASHERDVNFNSIAAGSGASGSSSSSSSSSAAAAAVTPAAFTQMPFTFVFKGSFFELAHLLGQVDGFAQTQASRAGGSGAHNTTVSDTGGIRVDGRLLTIQGVDIVLESQGSSGTSGSQLSATITATAYVLPASQGLTAGATPAGPLAAGTAASGAAASSAAASASSSPTSPAVIQGAP